MSDSNTSSELDIRTIGDKSENKKSSDTDYYFGLIANNNKIVPEKQDLTSSENVESEKSSSERRKTESSEKSKSSKSSHSSSRSKSKYTSVNMNHNSHNSHNNSYHHGVSASPVNSSESKNPSNYSPEPVKQLTPQELRMRKIELLRKLSEIKEKGYSLSKDYDFNSSVEEMEYEYDLLRSFAEKRNGVKMYKNMLLNGVSLVEWLNDKYDPFDFHLQGWGEHMSVEVDSFDDVLEEIYEKYRGTGKSMPPEIRLFMLIVASGAAFHFSKSQSSIPGLDKILSKNPELVSKMINPQKQASNYLSPQELNILRQRELIKQKEQDLRQKIKQQNQQPQMMHASLQPSNQSFDPAPANQSRDKLPRGGPDIRAPENVQEILSRLKKAQANVQFSDATESSTNNDRLISESNLSESKRGKKVIKPAAVSIRT